MLLFETLRECIGCANDLHAELAFQFDAEIAGVKQRLEYLKAVYQEALDRLEQWRQTPRRSDPYKKRLYCNLTATMPKLEVLEKPLGTRIAKSTNGKKTAEENFHALRRLGSTRETTEAEFGACQSW